VHGHVNPSIRERLLEFTNEYAFPAQHVERNLTMSITRCSDLDKVDPNGRVNRLEARNSAAALL
jgi:hypothetical protein